MNGFIYIYTTCKWGGCLATTIPNSTNASINQGNSTDNVTYPSANGYLGVLAIHTRLLFQEIP
ncbi:MAG: hypothetical protein IPH98_07475 [Saprospiraceae bacterium]|nr:hypothetical protein [Candidatus Defluviibacterium haderslevense]